MFDVVNDVASYSLFLPWCARSEVLETSDTVMVARLTLARGRLQQSFTTSNELHPPETIEMRLVDGPFSRFQGRWEFRQLGDEGCRISMNLRFDFDSRMMNVALGKVFNSAADRLVEAFCQRADTLYG